MCSVTHKPFIWYGTHLIIVSLSLIIFTCVFTWSKCIWTNYILLLLKTVRTNFPGFGTGATTIPDLILFAFFFSFSVLQETQTQHFHLLHSSDGYQHENTIYLPQTTAALDGRSIATMCFFCFFLLIWMNSITSK